jgi:hypothetical protein
MKIEVKIAIATIIFALYLAVLHVKVSNIKTKEHILKLEEIKKNLTIKLGNKKNKFLKITNPYSINKLAIKHKVILKDLENIKKIEKDKAKHPPYVKHVPKKT